MREREPERSPFSRMRGTLSVFSVQERSIMNRNPNFRRLFFGESVSYFGAQVSLIVLPLLAAFTLHASAFEMGILGALQFAPYFFLSPIAGVVADRHGLRRIGVMANAGRAILLGSVTLLAVEGLMSIDALYAVTLGVSCLGVFFEAAFWPFVHTVVEENDLVDANSKLISTQSAASVMGPGVGGFLVSLLTAPLAVLINVVSYAFSAYQMRRITVKEGRRTENEGPSARGELAEGFRIVLRNRILLSLLGEATTYNVFYQMILAAFFLYAGLQLGFSYSTIGIIFSIGGVGSLLGSFLVPKLVTRVRTGRLLLVGMFVGNSAWLLFALVRGPTQLAFPMISVLLLLDGVGSGLANVLTISIRQSTIPREMLARGMASYRTFSYGVVPLGALCGGFLGSTIGLWETLVVGAVGVFASSFWVLFSPVSGISSVGGVASGEEAAPQVPATTGIMG